MRVRRLELPPDLHTMRETNEDMVLFFNDFDGDGSKVMPFLRPRPAQSVWYT